MSNNLIIAPVHPPHFHWATKLLDSASSSENIALGFSNQNDANSFRHKFPFKILITNIPANVGGFVNKKKLDLLKQAYVNYDYVSVIDVECKFLKPVTPFLEEIWNNNCFVANHSTDGSRIMKELGKICGYNHNDDLYPWFNCIPVYKADLLPGFFNWMDSKGIFGISFEFLLFAMYCRYELNMPWKTLDGQAWHGLVENANYLKQNTHIINQLIWSVFIPGIESYPNIKMLFHLDRHPIK